MNSCLILESLLPYTDVHEEEEDEEEEEEEVREEYTKDKTVDSVGI